MSTYTDKVREELNVVTLDHIEAYANRLTELMRKQVSTLRRFTEDVTLAHYIALGYASMPKCEVLDTDTDSTFLFRISSPEQASCLGGIIGNDTNFHLHIGENSITQSNGIIGICTDAVMRTLGMTLTTVNPLRFGTAIPMEKSVLVTIEVDDPHGIKSKTRSSGTITLELEPGQKVMKTAQLLMVAKA